MMNHPADRLIEVRGNIARAAGVSGRAAEQIELVAVSKTHPPEALREVLDAGQFVFGESRVQ